MGQAKKPIVRGDEAAQLDRLAEITGEGLLADHVDAALEKGPGHGQMQLRRRGDDDGVDAVLARRLALGHLAVIEVDALFGEELGPAGRDSNLGNDGHRACDEIVEAVGPHGDEMRASDNGVAATSDEAQTQAPAELQKQGLVQRAHPLTSRSSAGTRRAVAPRLLHPGSRSQVSLVRSGPSPR